MVVRTRARRARTKGKGRAGSGTVPSAQWRAACLHSSSTRGVHGPVGRVGGARVAGAGLLRVLPSAVLLLLLGVPVPLALRLRVREGCRVGGGVGASWHNSGSWLVTGGSLT